MTILPYPCLPIRPQPKELPGIPDINELPVGRLQLMEVVDMIQDIARSRQGLMGPTHPSVGDAHLVTCLALIQLEEKERAEEQLEVAKALSAPGDTERTRVLDMARIMLNSVSLS